LTNLPVTALRATLPLDDDPLEPLLAAMLRSFHSRNSELP
jgi:hypothetical protein